MLLEPLDPLLHGRQRRRRLLTQLCRNLLVLQRVATIEEIRLQAVACLHNGELRLVLYLVRRRLLHHALNLLTAEATLIIRDGDLLGLARRLLRRRHIQDTVRINVKGDLNLRNATRHRRNALEHEPAEKVAILRKLALTLKHLDVDARLVVRIRGERLRRLLRDRRVTLDDRRHDATRSLEAEAERRHIEQDDLVRAVTLLRAAAEDVSLHRRTIGDGLVRVDAVVQLLAAEVIGEQLTDARDARRATHHDNLVNLVLAQLGIGQQTVKRCNRALEEGIAQALELSTGDRRLEVLAIRKTVHLDRRLRGGGQTALRLLTGRAQAAEGTRVI